MTYDMRVIDVRVTEMSYRTKTIYVKVHISQDFLLVSVHLPICKHILDELTSFALKAKKSFNPYIVKNIFQMIIQISRSK